MHMGEEKIGGLSLEEIMNAAMEGFADDTESPTIISDVNKTEIVNAGGIVMKKCSVCGAEMAVHYSQKKCRLCDNYFFGETDDVGNLVEESHADGVDVTIENYVIDSSSVDVKQPGVTLIDKKKDVVQQCNDDTYTIGAVRFVNVTNRLSVEYENMACDIMSYIDANRTAEAVQKAQQLVDHNISNEIAWLIYAYAKEAWGDNTMALKAYEQSVAINPRFALALNDIGVFYGKNENAEKAQYYFEKALENDPTNVLYMGNVAFGLCFTENYNAAIEKCKYFIDISDEKIYLQNMLGRIYVELSGEYVVDVPNAFDNPAEGTTPGFISLEDIQEVRKLCNNAKSLLTLEAFSDDSEKAETYLQLCDEDCRLLPCHKKSYVIIHAVIVCILYTFCTLIWGFPIALAVAIFTAKADYFPQYVFNYVWYTGSDDPLKYSRDSFYKNHDILKAAADGAKDGWNNSTSSSGSLSGEIFSELFKSQYWFFKARIQFYKRFIQQKKEQKKNSIGTVQVDDIQPK